VAMDAASVGEETKFDMATGRRKKP